MVKLLLECAAARGHEAVVKLLLEKGVEVGMDVTELVGSFVEWKCLQDLDTLGKGIKR